MSKDTALAILPRDGERALVIGGTGSGKTGLEIWLAARIDASPMIVYDTKDEPKFEAIPKAAIVHDDASMDRALEDQDVDYVVRRFSPEDAADPDYLDERLMLHYDSWEGVPALIDELYSFHRSGRAGPGLTAILTRGRSRGITCLMGTQRPAWISGFTMSEAQAFYVLGLTRERDKKAVADFVPGFGDLPDPPEHGFWYYRVRGAAPKLYPPVKLDEGIDTGYTVGANSHRQAGGAKKVKPLRERHNWL